MKRNKQFFKHTVFHNINKPCVIDFTVKAVQCVYANLQAHDKQSLVKQTVLLQLSLECLNIMYL